jgi:hypothetical protein
MQVGKTLAAWFAVLAVWIGSSVLLNATPRKVHVVGIGAVKRVPYSRTGDPAGAAAGEESLKIRPLVVDGAVKEWTAGESHDVTDRTFVVRRAIRLNDQLPGEKSNTGNHLGVAARSVADGGPRQRSCNCFEAAGLRPGREPGELVPRLRGVLRSDFQREKPVCGCRADRGPQTCACKEALRVPGGAY